MLKVKLSAGSHNKDFSFYLQTPSNSMEFGEYDFFVDDNEKTEYDYWIVLEDTGTDFKRAKCKKGGLIFIAGEPPSVRDYKNGFLNQFDYVIGLPKISNGKTKYINTHKFLPWHISKKYLFDSDIQEEISFNFLKENRPVKDKLLSVICSPKTFTQGHKDRIKFVLQLKEYFGDKIDVYGLDGFNCSTGLSHYKYHISIENSSYEHYWSEKLSDAFLAECYPFYFGAPNIYDYFDKNSLSTINIYNIEECIKKIETAISEDYYTKYQSNIQLSKSKILTRYNLFNLINELKIDIDLNSNAQTKTLLNERFFSSKFRALKRKIRTKLSFVFTDFMNIVK